MFMMGREKECRKWRRLGERELVCGAAMTLLVLVFLLVTGYAEACPTADSLDIHLVGCPSFSDAQNAVGVIEFTDADIVLVNIGEEIAKPYGVFSASVGCRRDYIESLPPMPGGISMVVMGFLCISLVRNNKVWLAGLASLLWAGQVGIGTIPRLALRFYHRASASAGQCCQGESAAWEGGDIKNAAYASVTNCSVGMPDGKGISWRSSRYERGARRIWLVNRFKTPQFAIVRFWPCLIAATRCLHLIAEQLVFFTPIFVWRDLCRGPPHLA